MMPVLRNRFSKVKAGGPRQFSEIRDRLLVSATDQERAQSELRSELRDRGFDTELVNGSPVLIAEPSDTIESVFDRLAIRGNEGENVREAISKIQEAREEGKNVIDTSSEIIEATGAMLSEVQALDQVSEARFVTTQADNGPENLRLSPSEMDTLDPQEAAEQSGTLQDLIQKMGVPEAWQVTRGENAVVIVFDTAFAEDLISEDRIVGTFHGGDTDSVYNAPEGHGTMCVGAAAANSQEGVPFDGVAPEADVALVRTTGSDGQIRSDIISKGWEWVINQDWGKPKVINHSYGTPICSGRPKAQYCSGPEVEMVKLANEERDLTSVYAAGNEAMTCGHRPSGLTNAITGTNSLSEVITVGALRFDGKSAQRYSSHGRGDCAPVADPKPNVSAPIPFKTYYGGEGGYKIKDMSTGIWGSSGGTSHAAPMTTGMIALMQSAAVEHRGEAMHTEEIKQILQNTATTPMINQINQVGRLVSQKGYDARFGHGQWQPKAAIDEVINNG